MLGKVRRHRWTLPRWAALLITIAFLGFPAAMVALSYLVDPDFWVDMSNEPDGLRLPILLPVIMIAVTVVAFLWLFLCYAGVQLGVVALIRIAFRQSWRDLRNSGRLHGRALPTMLFVTFLAFFAGEMWQLGAHITWGRTLLVMCLFALVTTGASASHLRDELDALDEVTLTGRQTRNVLTVLATRQLVQATVVGMAVFAFFTALGMIAVDPGTAETWVGEKPEPSLIPGASQALLRCAALLAGFGATNFAVSTMTDDNARREFFRPIVSDLQETLLRYARETRATEEREHVPPNPATASAPA
ncbi:hypothetical protein [Streptomyces sp. NPDC051776]|uniref:hypothetical protein n=1 Tax=Streptomyces sp. NPDC051776 TaxID=3155414 RepID=UPI00341D4552